MAKDRDLVLDLITKADKRGLTDTARGLDQVADSADSTGKSFRGMADDAGEVDDRVRKMTDRVKEAGDEADRTSKKLTKAAAGAATATSKAGSRIPSGAGGSIGLQGPLIGAAVVAGIAASPAIGAAIATVVMGGIGTGGVIGGIIAASKDPRVRAAASEVGATFKREWQDLGRGFVDPVVKGLGTLDAAVDEVLPGLFDHMTALGEETVPSLARGFALMAKNAVPGLEKLVDASEPLAEMFATHGPQLGDAFDEFFTSLAKSGPGATKFFNDMLDFTEDTIVAVGEITEAFSKTYDFIDRNGSALVATTGSLGAILDWINQARDTAPSIGEGWMRSFGQAGDAAAVAAGKQILFTDSLGNIHRASVTAATGYEAMTKGLSDYLAKQMAVDNATIGWQQSLDDLAEELGDGKRTLDINSQAGRDNALAILGAVGAADRLRQDMITKTPGAVNAANAAYQQAIAKIMKMGLEAGYTKKDLEELIGDYRVNIITTFRNVGKPPNTKSYSDIPTGRIGGYAEGGYPPMDGRAFTVGEKGMELASVENGRLRIHSAPQSRRMLSGGATSSGGTTRIELGWKSGAESAMLMAFGEIIRKYVQVTAGGNVQAALGR